MKIIKIEERADKHGKRCLEYTSATRTLASAAACFKSLTGQEPGNVYELTAPVKILGHDGPMVTTWFFEWERQNEAQ
jgi:hypothetical protein